MGMLRDSKFSQLGLLHMGGVFFKRQNHGRDLFFERELLVILSFPPRYNHMYNYKYIICMVVRIFLGGVLRSDKGKYFWWKILAKVIPPVANCGHHS